MKKVLVISQHGWPPKINAQILRLASLLRYLPENGWEPVVVARDTKGYDFTDSEFAGKVAGIRVHRYRGLLPPRNRVSMLLNAAFMSDAFLPDLLFNFGRIGRVIKEEKPDLIFASTPPSGLIAAYLLSRKFGIPMVIDYADPWTTSDFYRKQSFLHDSFYASMERRIISLAKNITASSKVFIKDLNENFSSKKYVWIPNGYDEKELDIKPKADADQRKIFTYAGTVHSEGDIETVLDIFSSIEERSAGLFELNIVGTVAPSVATTLSNYSFINITGYVGKKKYVEYLINSDILIFSLEKRYRKVLASRTAEYMATGKPVMIIDDEGSFSSDILKRGRTAFSFKKHEKQKAKEFIIRAIEGQVKVDPDMDYIRSFEWRNLSGELSRVFEEAVNE